MVFEVATYFIPTVPTSKTREGQACGTEQEPHGALRVQARPTHWQLPKPSATIHEGPSTLLEYAIGEMFRILDIRWDFMEAFSKIGKTFFVIFMFFHFMFRFLFYSTFSSV